MILKINFIFQLSILIFFAGYNLWKLNVYMFMYSLLFLGVLHIFSFVMLMIHPLSRSGKVFKNWMIYLAGIGLVYLLPYPISFISPEAGVYIMVIICLSLALFFVYNSYQLWKTWEYDNH